MPDAKLLVINITQEDEILEIFPRPPLLSSQKFGWNGIYVQSCQLPAWEMPEHYNKQHVICVKHCQQPYRAEQVIDGRRQNHLIENGNILFVPAHVEHGGRWNRNVNFTLLTLEPTEITSVLLCSNVQATHRDCSSSVCGWAADEEGKTVVSRKQSTFNC